MDWTIEYYVTPEGRCPIREFIDSLSVEGQAKYIFITRLHGFIKKTDKTPEKEIDIAEQRMKDYLSREV